MRRIWRVLAVGTAVALLAVGCDGKPKPTPSSNPRTVATATCDPACQAKVQELIDDSNGAVEVVDTYWRNHWSQFFTGSYSSPEVRGGYFGSENPPCGGEYMDESDNAYYCGPDDYIAWDWILFASNFLDKEIGDSVVWFVIAHEWSHAIQARLAVDLRSQSAELQADCLAAAVLVGAAADGTVTWEAGDRGEIFQALATFADEVEWGNTAVHGSADQRIEAYQLGESGGVLKCLPTS